MTRLNELLNRPTQRNATSMRGVVKEEKATNLAIAMQALYKECVAQVVNDPSMTFHVVMMPTMNGHHFTYTLRDELELALDCAFLLNSDIRKSDCLVVLGHDILSQDISEDAMMRIVLSDVAFHIRRLFPVTDAATGWRGENIGWAAIASVIAGAHPIMRTIPGMMQGQDMNDIPVINFHEEIANRAFRAVKQDHRCKTPELELDQNQPVRDVIERVCDVSLKNLGGYLQLPTTARQIHAVACENYYEATNSMGYTPRVLI